MGSYITSADYDADWDGPAAHRIYCPSGWATCHGSHEKVADVKDCFRKARVVRSDPDRYFACDWLVQGLGEDGPYTFPCGALARSRDDGGFDCEAGHEHTPAQVLAERGQAYAEDEDEARRLIKAGVAPLDLVRGTPFQFS